ncbi:Na+/proline symporter/signal transduction histidine kinase/ActR/RegA family two-component response regulator [Rhodoligotrophos appendicifer]|uniref:PAS domain-containing hybrid sensor histidine kinase/response regulator n=1 Tax=Rhodoligotrophos appendicifer TaxID=987056 RepID=UPI001186445A|nr:PAS domain-containing hybrid sensor histidine kinase/response regulator [Rhodoligotrophos appendicifer]
MFNSWTIIAVALGYLGALFAVASYYDRVRKRRQGTPRPLVYALSLGVYCTSWTFYGSVGLSARTGFEFLPIYIGPIIVFALGWPIIRHIVDLAKRHNITSIADFIAARYGKNQALGAAVSAVAVLGVIPYISLQLKAVANSLTTLLAISGSETDGVLGIPVIGDLALVVAIAMAAFTMLFGTRHIDATEHQDGVIAAIALESVVKLIAFLLVGSFIVFGMMGGVGSMIEAVSHHPEIEGLLTRGFEGGRWITMTLLSTLAVILLPRQFHVTVVENTSLSDVKRAAWLFPLYLVAINIFVVPIAIAGLLTFGVGATNADSFVLALPVAAGAPIFTLIAFIGGLSAATAMVIVASLALSIMVSNNIAVPLLLKRQERNSQSVDDMGAVLLMIRRGAILIIMALGYVFHRMIGNSFALADIGLLSFAAIAQFAPAFFIGLIWRRATAKGAMAGVLVGTFMWGYTLLLPALVNSGWFSPMILEHGPFDIALLRPEFLFNLEFEPLAHGVFWSLLLNITAYVSVSLLTLPQPIERLQASIFVSSERSVATPSFRLWRTAVSVGDVRRTVARYLGVERTDRSFAEFASSRNIALDDHAEADIRLLRFSEHVLASAVGAASSRLVLSLMLQRFSGNTRGAMRLLDDASAAIQYNRDLLQSAIDHVRQGIAVFDRDLSLICWNRQFGLLLELPEDMERIGIPIHEIARTIIVRADLGSEDPEKAVTRRINNLIVTRAPYQERMRSGTIIEARSNLMPDGGIVVTFADITEREKASEALQKANESLERRVQERTVELLALNSEYGRAKAEAEAANLGKTRFIAAASHDILQPLNAARLYTSSLVERNRRTVDKQLIRNIDASLEAVEEILSALLDISRLDAGAMKPDLTSFQLDELFKALEVEFGPVATEKGLKLTFVATSLTVQSDRRLLRRALQNLVSNGIKYTQSGGLVVGCRQHGGGVAIEVHDSGPGIPDSKLKVIFQEFQRLDSTAGDVPGLGLGLSIVERIVNVLGHSLDVRSKIGRGSVFAIHLPTTGRASQAPKVRLPRIPTAHLNGISVLCIDNEAAILEGMESLLSAWGCQVMIAKDAEEAMAWIREDIRVDIILADYHLQQDTGLALIERLRRKAQQKLPAVLITADRSRILQSRATDLDVGYLTKPLRPASLRALIAQSLIRAAAEVAE